MTRGALNGLLTGTSLDGIADSLDYTGFRQVQSYTAKVSGADLFACRYAYDQLGNITRKTETVQGVGKTYEYRYDLAGRPIEVERDGVVVSSYAYDSNGNRLSAPGLGTAPTYDDQDRLTDYAGTSYTYSENGELGTKTAGAFTTTYAYDVLGNLLRVTLPEGAVIDYVIDGQNRRVGKKVNGILVQGFLYQDHLHPVAELDGGNQIVSRFVYGSKTNVPDYVVKGGMIYRIISDHLASPRVVVNTDTGDILQRMDMMSSAGLFILDTNPDFQPFGFAGGLYDRDTGLVRFGARDYDPETGRWTTKDPIRFAGGDTNLYGYVLNDPINLTDPFGLAPGDLNGATYATLGGAVHGAAEAIRGQSSQGVEWFCWICRDQNGYHYTDPRTDNRPTRVKPGPLPNNCPVAGDFHNHPNIPGYNHNDPSSDDRRSNYINQIPGFLLTPSDTIRRYDPAPSGAEVLTIQRAELRTITTAYSR